MINASYDGNIQSQKQKEANPVKTKFYFNGKKITKKAAAEMLGKDRLNRMIKEAKETFLEDPWIAND